MFQVVDNIEEERTAKLMTVTTTPKAQVPSAKRGRTYTSYITGLRMATTYSFEVRPVRRDARDLADPNSIGSKIIIVPTKGCKLFTFTAMLNIKDRLSQLT